MAIGLESSLFNLLPRDLYQISEITLSLATSALQQIFRLHSCLAILAMVTRSRQKICAASLPNLTLFLIFGIRID